MIDCEDIQAALSARLDGEEYQIDDDIIDAHLQGCAECSAYWEKITRLQRELSFTDSVDTPQPSEDLSHLILAGVEEERKKRAANRFLGIALGRIFLFLHACIFIWWAINTLGLSVTEENSALVDIAATRLALGFGLFFVIWKPRLAAGIFPIYAAMWSFSFGFHAQELFFGGFAYSNFVLLTASIGIAWIWLIDYGIDALKYSWRQLGSNKISAS